MNPILVFPMLAISAAAFVLGFTLHRHSICAVVATRELIVERKPDRLIAFFEAAAWGSLALMLLGGFPAELPTWSPVGLVLLGSVAFGLGSWVNGACAFGMIGHFGNGEVDYLFAIAGLIVGGFLVSLLTVGTPEPAEFSSSLMTPFVAIGFGFGFFVVRLIFGAWRGRMAIPLAIGMATIGITFALISHLEGGWPLTSLLVYLPTLPVLAALTTASMIFGSLLSGWISGRRFKFKRPTLKSLGRRMLGGTLMGMGASLVPGGNDALLLQAIPAGAWQAALSYTAMIATLGLLIHLFGSSAMAWRPPTKV